MADSIDLDAVGRRIEEEYLRARDALHTLKKYLGNGENGSAGRTPPIAIDLTNEPTRHDLTQLTFNDEENSQTIIDKVEQIMQSDTRQKWSVPLMVAHLRTIGFPLQAKKPEATMGLVFSKLMRNRKTVVRVRRGSGRTPNLFRGIPKEHQEDASDSSDSQNQRAAS